jgi:hypothetical protein
VEAEPCSGTAQDAVHDLGVLGKPFHPFSCRPRGGADGLMIETEDARAEAQVESAVGEVIERHRVRCGHGRRPQDRIGHQRSDPDPTGEGGGDREQGPGVVPVSGETARIADVVGQVQLVEAKRFSLLHT